MAIWDTIKGVGQGAWDAANKFGSSPIGQGVISFAGQQNTNAANAKQARENMEFQDAQAKQQMQFQERMSGTAVQRHVEDLRAAGLNPALAFSSQGASSPAGAAGGGSQAQMADATAAGISSARAERMQRKELEVMEETRNKTASEAQDANVRMLINRQTQNEQMERIRADLATAKQAREESAARTKMYDAQAANVQQDSVLRAFEIPKLRAESQMYDSVVGGLLPWLGSARSAAGLFRGAAGR